MTILKVHNHPIFVKIPKFVSSSLLTIADQHTENTAISSLHFSNKLVTLKSCNPTFEKWYGLLKKYLNSAD